MYQLPTGANAQTANRQYRETCESQEALAPKPLTGHRAPKDGNPIVRLLEKILLIIGAPALGVVSGVVLAFVVVLAVSAPRPGREPGTDWGPAFFFAFLAIGGGISGGIAGFIGAVRRITNRPNEPWTRMTWIGVALGFAIAIAIRFLGAMDSNVLGNLIRWPPGMGLFLAAAAALGGILGTIGEARWKRSLKD